MEDSAKGKDFFRERSRYFNLRTYNLEMNSDRFWFQWISDCYVLLIRHGLDP